MIRTRTLITIHSGALDVPANTGEYIRRALGKRPDIIEVDVRRTRDGVAVLSHDPILPGEKTPLSRMSLEQCRTSYSELLTLEEAVNLCSADPLCLNLDIKEFEVIPLAAGIIERNQGSGPFIFSGCGENEVRELLSVFPGARVLYNVRPWNSSEFPDYNRYILTVMDEAEKLGCFGLNISHEDLRPELMGYSRLFDIPVFVWTVDDRRIMRELIMMGVYSITTNKVDLLREVMAHISSRRRRLEDTDWVKP